MSELDPALGGDNERPRSFEEQMNEQREQIDGIDRAIVVLLGLRARTAIRVGEIKLAHGQPIFVAAREADVIAKVVDANDGLIPDEDIETLFKDIMRTSRGAQQRVFDNADPNWPNGPIS